MTERLNRIYTRSGDKGTTALANGSRVKKTHPRIEALGTVDELNALLGMLIAELNTTDPYQTLLSHLQHDLFDLGGELAVADDAYIVMEQEQIDQLENHLDKINDQLPALKEFILPSGGKTAATCQLARSVCRRAERRLIELHDAEAINPFAVAYLNRLSDLLFVLARVFNRRDGEEVYWKPKHSR